MVELIKFVVCAVVVACRRKLRPMMGGDVFRSDAYRMRCRACYVVQHNLLYVALTNLPAVTSMVLVQTKLLWAASSPCSCWAAGSPRWTGAPSSR